MTVMKVILVPLVLGLLAHRLMGEKHVVSLSKILVLVSAFGVLVILGGVIAVNGAKILDMGVFVIVMVLLHNLGGFLLGYVVTGLLGLGKSSSIRLPLKLGCRTMPWLFPWYRYSLPRQSRFRLRRSPCPSGNGIHLSRCLCSSYGSSRKEKQRSETSGSSCRRYGSGQSLN